MMDLTNKPWVRTVGAVLIAVLCSLAVSAIGRREAWPHTQSIAFAVFLALIPVLQPSVPGRVQSWARRLSAGVVFGVVGGLFHAFFLD